MLTFNSLYTRVQNMTNDTTAGTLVIIKQLINESYKEAMQIGSVEDEGTYYRFTTANKDFEKLPNDYERMRSVQSINTDTSGTATATTANKLVDSTASFADTVVGKIVGNTTDNTFTVVTAKDSATTLSLQDDIFADTEGYQIADGTAYISEPIYDETIWNILKSPQVNSTTEVLTNHFFSNDEIKLYPTPGTTNNILVMDYSKRIGDMDDADYTIGTITVVKGSTTVTGSGTTFTVGMVGQSIKIGKIWYRIGGFTSTTVITLEKPLQETGVAGASYTIGEVPLIAEHLQASLAYEATAFIYRRRESLDLAREYDRLWEKAKKEMMQYAGSEDEGITARTRQKSFQVVDSTHDKLITRSF